MEAIRSVQGRVAPINRNDVDTDQIIPARYLVSVSKEGYGEGLFSDLRKEVPELSINQPEFNGAKVLVVGDNFGCGSSREHAVWAIKGAGFKAVIGKSFADIFSSNSAKNGLLLVTLPEEVVDSIIAKSSGGDYSVFIDIEKQTVTLPEEEVHKFSYDSFRKHCLINGLDDIDYILSKKSEIDDYVERRKEVKFFNTTSANR